MKQTRRKLWTWTISAVAALLVLAAVVTGLFRGAVLLVPDYRDDLERKLSELSGYPVRIGEMDMRWIGLSPALDLDELMVMRPGGTMPAVHVRQLVLSTSLLRLLHGDWMPSGVSVDGLSLGVERDENGRWRVRGFDTADDGPGPELQTVLDRLAKLRSIRLTDCALEVRDPRWLGEEVRNFEIRELSLGIGAQLSRAQATLQPPADFGGPLQVEAALEGPINRPQQWRLEASLRAAAVDLAELLRPWVLPQRALRATGVRIEARASTVASGRLAGLGFSIEARTLDASGADRPPLELTALNLGGRWQGSAREWSLQFDRLKLKGPGGPWPDSRASLQRKLRGPDAEWQTDLGFLRFDDLGPLLNSFQSRPAAQLASLRGELRNGVLFLSQAEDIWRYRYRADIDNAGVDDGAHRFVGLSGALSGDEQGGRLHAQATPAVFGWPDFFGAPIEFESLGGELSWNRTAEGWRIAATDAKWQLVSGHGEAQAELLLPRAGEGRIKLSSSLAADDVMPLKSLMPIKWRPSLRDWLERGIRGGRVPQGRLALDAALSEFGRKRIPDSFELDLQVADGRLAFLPGWPEAQALEAALRFRGNGLTVRADRGTLGGLSVDVVQARFADFSDRMLTVGGRIHGDAARFYQTISRTPLRERLSALLDRTDPSGPTSLDLAVEIPLGEDEPPRVSGDIHVQNGLMQVVGLPAPVEAISGTVHFDGDGVRAQDLGARWRGVDLKAEMAPVDPRTTRLELAFALDAQTELLAAVPAWVRSRLRGRSDWEATLVLGGDGEPQPIVLRSELAGLAVDLPAPLYAAAGEAGPLRIELLRDDAAAGLRFEAQQGQRLTVRGLLADRPAGTPRPGPGEPPEDAMQGLRYLQVWFGPDPPPAPPSGIVVRGTVDAVDARGWSRVYRNPETGGVRIEPDVSVQVGSLRYGPMAVNEVRLNARRDHTGWAARLDGAHGRGSLHYPDDPQGRVEARFERLALAGVATDDRPRFDATQETLDPTTLPTLDLQVAKLSLDDVELGEFRMRTSRLPAGQRIDELSTSGKGLKSKVSGQWTRAAEHSGASLDFNVASNRIADVLEAFGYARNLEAKRAEFRGSLSWDDAGGGLSLAQARGKVALSAEKGRLRTVEPGAGRVLGLVNFYALPRRLTLNFSDVVGEGLAFDKVDGGFALGDGKATTDDLDIDAPSLRIEVRGAIGLAERNYDQRVTVFPDMSGGVTLGAVLLGGPAVGVIALLAQELLDKPLDQVSQLSYHVSGSWDNPQVKRIDGGS